jgi:hypothetical protein
LEEWNGGRMGKEGYWILDTGYWMPKEWERRRIHPASLYELWRGKGRQKTVEGQHRKKGIVEIA